MEGSIAEDLPGVSNGPATGPDTLLPKEITQKSEPAIVEVVVGPSKVHDTFTSDSLGKSETQNAEKSETSFEEIVLSPSEVHDMPNSDPSEEHFHNSLQQTNGVSVNPEPPNCGKDEKHIDLNRGLIDTAAPFESVKEAVTMFGGIVDWKAHKIQSLERRKFIEHELEMANKEIPEFRIQSKVAEDAKIEILKELDNTKRLVEELKLNLERAQVEEQQAKQDCELVKLRVEEMEQGVGNEASVAAKAQLEVAKARHESAVRELISVKNEGEKLLVDYASLLSEKEMVVKRSEEANSISKEVEKTVEELTLQLIATKESLESAHSAHLEAEEQRIGADMVREQDSLRWEKELKEKQDELENLKQQVLSVKDLKSKLESSSGMIIKLKGELEESENNETNTGLHETVSSVRKELEQVKLAIEKATAEVNFLKVAATSLKTELERENSALSTIKQREGIASIAVSSLEAELNKIRSEVALVQMKEKEAREIMSELPKQLHQTAQEGDRAKSSANLAREELRKAEEEFKLIKSRESTIKSRLLAVQKEIEATRASERFAIAAIHALQESESPTKRGPANDNEPGVVLISVEEYYELSKRANEAEERAKLKLEQAFSQIEMAKESEAISLEKLEEVNREKTARKEALIAATGKAEKAQEGKLGIEQELRKWRAENEQRRKASDASQGIVYPPRRSFEVKKDNKEAAAAAAYLPLRSVSNSKLYSSSNNIEPDSSPEISISKTKKKKRFFPRFLTFLTKKKPPIPKPS